MSRMTPDTASVAMREALERAAPRPWRIVRYGDGDSLVIHDARGDFRVCFMATPGDSAASWETIKANARLIVSAVNALATSTAPSEPTQPQDVGEVLEQAAKVAEEKAVEYADAENAGDDEAEEAWHGGMAYAAISIAAAIRAFKPASLASGEK